ncbi:MAG: hypothetical protein HY741_25275 [Chloroflexi bacterium]|nr:hypothetical protein [Chloroflexota bacterium]
MDELQIGEILAVDQLGHRSNAPSAQGIDASVWPTVQVQCDANPPADTIPLYLAKNNDPLEIASDKPTRTLQKIQGHSFLSFDFKQVRARQDGDPNAKIVLALSQVGPFRVYGDDPRTLLPAPVSPTGFAQVDQPEQLEEIDTRIQIVWPHSADGTLAPVGQAEFVNIAVDLFRHGSLESVPLDYAPNEATGYPILYIAREDKQAELYAATENPQRYRLPRKTTFALNGQTFPRWVFDNVPIEPNQDYFFVVLLSPVSKDPARRAYPIVWSYTAKTRTVLSQTNNHSPCLP